MARTRVLSVVVLMAALQGGALSAEPEGFVSKDSRLDKAVTLDDYHPWTPPGDPGAWRERAQRVREQVLVAAGLWPMPPRGPVSATVHGKIERDGYTVEKVFLESWPGFYVTGNLYRPAAPASLRRPAVLSPHGHWANGRFYENSDAGAKQEIEKGWEKTLEGARYPLQARCAMLARMGCVVFHYDMVGTADSKQVPHASGFGDVEAELRLQSAFGLQTFNSIRALDFLAGLPDVDPGRIGVTGASGGGTQTFILCGIDDRPAVAFPAVMVSTAMQGGCVCENATLLRVGTGNIEFAALTAPRPLGMTGANDWTLEIETKGLPELKALYATLGVPDLVDAKCYPTFPHNYNQVSRERMYAWMNRHLKLGLPEPIEEKPFLPIPPKELSVFDADHPLPANASDIHGLRQVMSEISNRQMAELTPKDGRSLAEYRRVVWAALRAIISSEVPPAEKAVAVAAGRRVGDGFTAERLTLTRPGSGEEVPAVWAEPVAWNGKVVVLVLDDTARGGALGTLLDERPGGLTPGAPGASVLGKGAALLIPEVFLTGRLVPAGREAKAPVDAQRHGKYCGYTWGYNRTPMAQRVHDVLTAVGYAQSVPGTNGVFLAGAGEGGLWAVLASALAGRAVRGTLAERPPCDFQEVKDSSDLRFLPGGVKYGGWGAFGAVVAPGNLWIAGKGDLPPVLEAAFSAAGARDHLRQLAEADAFSGAIAKLLDL
jgi:hypothetical protein